MTSQFNPTGKPAKFTEGQRVRNIARDSHRYGWVGTIQRVQPWLLGYDVDYVMDTHRPLSGDYPFIAECEGNLEAIEAPAQGYTTDEAATVLQIQPRTVTRYILRGLIRAEKKGRDYLIPEAELERFQRERRKPGKPQRRGAE